MAKPVRSPLLGYNHNVKYKGRIYHVQTEDSGPTNPRLFTHLYFEGTILSSKRHDYDANSAEETVRGLMQGQHKAILKDLKQSLLDDKLSAFFARRSEPFEFADEITEQQAVPVPIEDPLSAPLDLDSLPVAIVETPPPEVTQAPLPTGGPGVYVMKKSGDGLVPEAPRAAAPAAVIPASSSDGLLPVVVFDPAPSASTPPPIPRAAVAPSPPRFPASAHTPRPQVGTGVVVQRQVVVGTGAPTPPPVAIPGRTPPPRTRRPAPSIPYVVKEGSHTQTRPAGPPARPMVPPPTTAPRTATATYNQGGAQPAPTADVISDKSLDEVILAYLSQGDVKE
jgi:hypothetical protein